MERRGLALLLSLICFSTFWAKDTKQPLRAELAERQHLLGYSLVDTLNYGGEVLVVSVEDRTSTRAKARNIQTLTSPDCTSSDGRYSVFKKSGLWVRDNESGESQQVEAEAEYSGQCFSPERKFVYSSGNIVRIYDLAKKKSMDIGDGHYPSWSPDGSWLGFDDGRHYVLLNVNTGTRKRLFSTKYGAGPFWSPDSRYLSYVELGGGTGGFLFWGIKCIEPYRVWIWRVDDDAHDWVQQICKPGRSFVWVRSSDLLLQ